MKHAITIILLLLVISVIRCGTANIVDESIQELLKNKAYFELSKEFNLYKHELSAKLKLEVEAHLFNVFNKNEKSIEAVELVLEDFGDEMSDSSLVKLLLVNSDNFMKLFEYKKAFETNRHILEKYPEALDSAMRADLLNMNRIFEPLFDARPQHLSVIANDTIPITRDKAGLMNIDVEIDDTTYDFIFDTGAGMNVIKKSFALELGLTILETSIDVKAATGKIIKSSLVVIDSLQFGEILVTDAVFLVMEDEMLEFPQIDYFPLAVIGFPVIKELGEFSITKTDFLSVKKEPTPGNFTNMRLDGLSPHVYLFNGKDSLEFAFDTGATKSHFTSAYFEKYRKDIESSSNIDSVTTSSAGGSKRHATYLLDNTNLFIGAQKAVLNSIHVHTQINETFDGVYGNLGQDLISQFDLMTMNFQDMYLKFE